MLIVPIFGLDLVLFQLMHTVMMHTDDIKPISFFSKAFTTTLKQLLFKNSGNLRITLTWSQYFLSRFLDIGASFRKFAKKLGSNIQNKFKVDLKYNLSNEKQFS